MLTMNSKSSFSGDYNVCIFILTKIVSFVPKFNTNKKSIGSFTNPNRQ